MKKILSVGLALVALLPLVSCQSNANAKDSELPEEESDEGTSSRIRSIAIDSVLGHDEQDTIVGNFTGQGMDTIYVYSESSYPDKNELDQYVSYYAKSNNPDLPTIQLWGCDMSQPKLVYEGDVDGNGRDEWGYIHTWLTSQWRTYRVYTLVGKEWRFLLDPRNELLSTDESFRNSGVEIIEKCDKRGYIKINYSNEGVDKTIHDTIVAATYTRITDEVN
jgi:hypothetical protein